jgi:hypothetical protein
MRVRGYESLQVVEIPGSTDLVVVTEYQDFRGEWPNLFRVSATGDERWAAAPGGADAYSTVELHGELILGRTHYGRERRVALSSGEIVGAADL